MRPFSGYTLLFIIGSVRPSSPVTTETAVIILCVPLTGMKACIHLWHPVSCTADITVTVYRAGVWTSDGCHFMLKMSCLNVAGNVFLNYFLWPRSELSLCLILLLTPFWSHGYIDGYDSIAQILDMAVSFLSILLLNRSSLVLVTVLSLFSHNISLMLDN